MLQKGLSTWLTRACLALACYWATGVAPPLYAAELLVVMAPESGVQSMSERELVRIYQRKVLISAAGVEWFPVNLPSGHPFRQVLSQRLFKQRPEAMVTYWSQKYYQGVSPPYVLQSQEAVIRFVAQRPGAVGYIQSCKLDERVRVVHTLQVALGTAVVDAQKCFP